jgi:hypothetical protein
LCCLETGKSKSDIKMKNTIGDGMEMFWKYQLTVLRSIQNFYSHFTKVTRKCASFSHIVEPWKKYIFHCQLLFILFFLGWNRFSWRWNNRLWRLCPISRRGCF